VSMFWWITASDRDRILRRGFRLALLEITAAPFWIACLVFFLAMSRASIEKSLGSAETHFHNCPLISSSRLFAPALADRPWDLSCSLSGKYGEGRHPTMRVVNWNRLHSDGRHQCV
jgi:hypothetical protein